MTHWNGSADQRRIGQSGDALKGRAGLPPDVRRGDPEAGNELAVRLKPSGLLRSPREVVNDIAQTPDGIEHLGAALTQSISGSRIPWQFEFVVNCLRDCILNGDEHPSIAKRAMEILGSARRDVSTRQTQERLCEQIGEIYRILQGEVAYLEGKLRYPEYLLGREERELRDNRRRHLEYLQSILPAVAELDNLRVKRS